MKKPVKSLGEVLDKLAIQKKKQKPNRDHQLDSLALKVESGVPIPSIIHRSSIASLMSVGDSVVAPTRSLAQSISTSIRNQGYKPVIRMISDGKIRVWKTLA